MEVSSVTMAPASLVVVERRTGRSTDIKRRRGAVTSRSGPRGEAKVIDRAEEPRDSEGTLISAIPVDAACGHLFPLFSELTLDWKRYFELLFVVMVGGSERFLGNRCDQLV